MVTAVNIQPRRKFDFAAWDMKRKQEMAAMCSAHNKQNLRPAGRELREGLRRGGGGVGAHLRVDRQTGGKTIHRMKVKRVRREID